MKLNLRLLFSIALIILSFSGLRSQTDKFILEGVWVVDNYKFMDISAMDDSIATQWLGKKAVIKEQLYFEYSKISNYRDIFKDNNFCNFRTHQMREKILTEKYFLDNYPKMSSRQLGINQNKITVIYTKCTGTPFSEIVILTDKQIMICWDGTFFFLGRQK